MAVKDSEELKTDERYPLGDYSFRIERSSVPGSTNDKIEAICTDKDGHNARKSIQVLSSAQLNGWYVETNETEATVYALVKVPSDERRTSELNTSPFLQPIPVFGGMLVDTRDLPAAIEVVTYTTDASIVATNNGQTWMLVMASSSPFSYTVKDEITYKEGGGHYETETVHPVSSRWEHQGKTVYFYGQSTGMLSNETISINVSNDGDLDVDNVEEIAWTMIYGSPSGTDYETKTQLIGRFAIDLEDAGGVGPGGGTGGGWTDPGDYDEDWEEGDPTHTLYVTVTGALSGRHNDPIEDPSYSYIPADKDTVKGYGCGGDGGHGGGGGAGASTVVIHKFATNQANSKEVTAIARRHGYGSGGGKGGKGGDGCILVYY